MGNILLHTWLILTEMSPYLLFGFLFAGILKIVIPEKLLTKHLSKNTWSSPIKAALIGVPLPVCSCGVIPVASHLKKAQASDGAILSFLTSTPTSGIDSFFATYSLMGMFFAVIRVMAAFFIGVFSGILLVLFKKDNQNNNNLEQENNITVPVNNNKLRSVIKYAFVDLIDDTWKWLLTGIIAGGLISALVPESLVHNFFSSKLSSYLLMLIIGTPMYVCATGSIPIAASLILKGISPGAALIFLIVGPATNTATISFISGTLGIKTTFIYLLSITGGAICFALITDLIAVKYAFNTELIYQPLSILPEYIKILSAIILLSLIINNLVRKKVTKKVDKCPKCHCKDM